MKIYRMITGLRGFIQHSFTDGVDKLNDAYDALHERLENVKIRTLEKIIKSVPHYAILEESETTADGGDWFAIVKFNNGIAITFPWLDERKSINVYYDRNRKVDYRNVDKFLGEVAERMNAYLRTL